MKDPAVLFYTSDFISGTLTMTDSQRGKYIMLLCLQHQQGFLSNEDMLNICKSYDDKIYKKFIKGEDGNFYNERMREETDKRKKYSESRSKNRTNICKSYDKHMENENENINSIKEKEVQEKKPLNISFEVFWNLYDKKRDKIKCERKWNNLTDTERELCIKNIPAYKLSTPDKQFRRDPETYLNNKSWENEIILPAQTKVSQVLTYEEMLKLGEKDPDVWKKYKAIKREGERKATFELIQQ